MPLASMLALFHLLMVPLAWLLDEARQLRARLEKQYQICTNCGYNRRGLPLGTPCPECGTPLQPVQELPKTPTWLARGAVWLTVATYAPFLCFSLLLGGPGRWLFAIYCLAALPITGSIAVFVLRTSTRGMHRFGVALIIAAVLGPAAVINCIVLGVSLGGSDFDLSDPFVSLPSFALGFFGPILLFHIVGVPILILRRRRRLPPTVASGSRT
jgi:hypothetical protein